MAEATKKWGMVIAIAAVLVGAAAGIFKAVGCEKGVSVTEKVSDALGAMGPTDPATPDAGPIVELEPPLVITASAEVMFASDKCGDVTVPANLRKGDKGAAVRALQQWLSCEGNPVEVDGVYGDATEAAVERLRD